MANLLPQNFVEPPRWAIPSYNYVDIDEGTGVVIYYGAVTDANGILTRYAIASGIYGFNGPAYGITTPTAATSASTTYVEVVTKSFDVVFNSVPKVITGKMHVSVPMGRSGNGVSNMFTMDEVYKLDSASNATLLVSGSSQVMSPDVNGIFSGNSTMTLTIPQTAFNVGEGLRVKIRLWANNPAANANNYAIGHDPQGRKDPNSTFKCIADTTSTVMACYIPFKINIHN